MEGNVNNRCSTEERIEHDTRHMLNIFPLEVWLLIIDQIADSDKENVSNSSLFFREKLLPQRTLFLFKSVWRILVWKPVSTTLENAWTDSVYDLDEEESEDSSVKNYRKNHKLHLTLVHRLRTICKSWNEAVTHLYENLYISTWKTRDNSPRKRHYTLKVMQNKFCEESPTDVKSFVSHFKQTHGTTNKNPFFGRRVSLKFDTGVVKNNLLRMFTKYGHHIWYCTIKFDEFYNPSNELTCYLTIRTLLQLMPSLKLLRVEFFPSTNQMRLCELEHMNSEIRAQPFPTLNCLQVLIFSSGSQTTPIIQELICRNPHISTLDISHLFYHKAIYTVPLPELKVLYINVRTGANFFDLMNPLVKFPLTKLCFSVKDSHEFIDWQRIFSALQCKWTDSLTELVINMPKATELNHQRMIFHESRALQLSFPHLKTLSISMSNLCCLDFLMSLKTSLVHLSVRVVVNHVKISEYLDVDKLDETSRIKLWSFASQPFDSNIWSLLPKLQRIEYFQKIRRRTRQRSYYVSIEEWSHSRGDWEREKNKVKQIVHLEK